MKPSWGTVPASLAVAGVLLLAGCDSARDAMGLNKQSINEFEVVPQAPLSLPPNFELRPPRPGAQRPQEVAASDAARGLLAGSRSAGAEGAAAAGGSAAEQALLKSAGAAAADPGIRAALDRESAVLSQVDEDFVDRLVFWRSRPEPGTIVDPEKEAERLRRNREAGKPVTEGETPVIKRDPKGWQ